MQTKASQVLNNTQEQTQGPVEIDAALLQLIGGGLPKGTWHQGEEVNTVQTPDSGGSNLPKGTW